ncbi:MAG: YdcF family protein [Oscillospiraceae bacterium]|nr:YdcF family protein [Oscillospiraceae bacterium]
MLGIRKRYWIVALAQLGAGLFFYYFVYAYQFTGVLLCGLAAVTMAFGALNLVKRAVFRIIFICLLIAASIMAVITGTNIHSSSKGSEDPKADYAIVLGAGVNGSTPSASLRERIRAAKTYAETYPQSILILSGSQGENEEISEAQCMYDCLVEEGISPSRLYLEEAAQDTQQNISLSLELIEAEFGETPEQICIISSEYHLLRAGKHAEALGISPLLYPARTENRLYFCNMFLREIVAIWAYELS